MRTIKQSQYVDYNTCLYPPPRVGDYRKPEHPAPKGTLSVNGHRCSKATLADVRMWTSQRLCDVPGHGYVYTDMLLNKAMSLSTRKYLTKSLLVQASDALVLEARAAANRKAAPQA